MRHELNFWVVGGDMRQAKLAEQLSDDGHTVHTYALDRAPEPVPDPQDSLEDAVLADCVILPLPAAGEGGMLNAPMSGRETALEEVMDALRPGQVVCAGRVTPELEALAERYELRLYDYFAREELAVANAVPTAEGAVQIAMEELPITLHRARVLVLGFGRLVKLAADLAWAEAYGYGAERIDQLGGWLCAYDLVINTVPGRVLGAGYLADLKPGCLVVDLASKPGGVDLEAASQMGVRVIWALSLPGKVAPVTAGRAIRDTIYHILHELGV